MTYTSWQEQFQDQIQIAKAHFEKASADGGYDGTFLFFCLKTGAIGSEEYLNWARETHQIAVLSESFFTKHPPTLEVFSKYRSKYIWTQQCLPIAEWDGKVIVACLEVPEDYGGQAIFLLTSYENLESTWSTFTATTAIGSMDSPEEIDLSAMTELSTELSTELPTELSTELSAGSPVQEIVLSDEPSESEEQEASAPEGSVSGIPDGFFGDFGSPAPTVSLANLGAITLGKPTPPAVPEATQSIDTSVVMEASMQQPNILTRLEVTSEEADQIRAVMPKAAIEQVSSLVPLKAVVTDEFANAAIVPLAPPPSDDDTQLSPMHQEMLRRGPRTARPVAIDTLPLDDDSDDEPQTQKKTLGNLVIGDDLPKAPMKMTQAPVVGAAAYLLEKIRKNQQEKFDKEVIACFNQCKTFFKKSMLLAIGDKDRVVKPILWDGGDFDIKKPSMVEFSLKIPSIFRVVSGTQKPYHGYVVTNDLNEAFFESWNHGQVPDHVTIVPLMDNDLVVGMLMGFGEKSSYNKGVLQFSENAAKELSEKILRTHARAA